ncbi:MAG: histidinol-phosphate aminotransferase family protein [Planctomycetes bacterium]|nr:histidinol-phosphate aminotransferase family protein [Planctomycetota bacterium]MCB9885129.1 histidinol-phosphate aminotransferase family protein [Planctomycetota bacterium]
MNDSSTDGPRPRDGLPTRAYTRPQDDAHIDLWLDSNEGPAANARRFASAPTEVEALRSYPNDRALRLALAARFGVGEEQVAIGTGADELLDRICRAFLAPGRRLCAPSPCFPMLPRYGQLAGAELAWVPWHDGALPTAALLARTQLDGRPTVLFLTTPNNPTGLVIGAAELVAIAAALPQTLVVADLAYVEFADDDPTAALLALPNVLVVRTFSKGFGLAGLRVGYAMGAAEVIAALTVCGSPFPVAAPSLALALLALQTGPDGDAIAAVRRERELLALELRRRGFAVSPPAANFVFARADRREQVEALAATLRQRGIQIRTFAPDDEFLARAVRITCPGDAEAFRRLCAALPGADAR